MQHWDLYTDLKQAKTAVNKQKLHFSVKRKHRRLTIRVVLLI